MASNAIVFTSRDTCFGSATAESSGRLANNSCLHKNKQCPRGQTVPTQRNRFTDYLNYPQWMNASSLMGMCTLDWGHSSLMKSTARSLLAPPPTNLFSSPSLPPSLNGKPPPEDPTQLGAAGKVGAEANICHDNCWTHPKSTTIQYSLTALRQHFFLIQLFSNYIF